jgi:hypothetical protein
MMKRVLFSPQFWGTENSDGMVLYLIMVDHIAAGVQVRGRDNMEKQEARERKDGPVLLIRVPQELF